MNLKQAFVNSIIIFVLASLSHFAYTTIPCFFTSIFFPVNESIFEHIKILFTSEIAFTFITYFFHHKENNLFLRCFLRCIILTSVLLLIYLPIHSIFGKIIIVTLIILFISIFITEIIMSVLPLYQDYKYLNIISFILLILSYILFAYLTYNPPKIDFFYDTEHQKYGIDILDD